MEIKVECVCGQRFKFDIEPVNGRMPHSVNCPACGADGTESANLSIQQTQMNSPTAAAPEASLVPAVPPMGSPTKLRISSPSPTAARAEAPEAAPMRPMPSLATAAAAPPKPERKANFMLGVVGALIGSFIGMMAWYLLIKLTGYEIRIVAWGVGVITGVGARMLGGKGSPALGGIAALLAMVAVIGGQYLVIKNFSDKFLDTFSSIAYDARMEFAKQIAGASSDEDVRAVLRKHKASHDVSDADWEKFREKELPELRAMAEGKVSREDFDKSFGERRNSWEYNLNLMKASVGIFTILWLFLGVGSAFKIAAGDDES